jgi:hypothetical protein
MVENGVLGLKCMVLMGFGGFKVDVFSYMFSVLGWWVFRDTGGIFYLLDVY